MDQRKERKTSIGYSMQTCTWYTTLPLAVADNSSDGPTPEAKTKQILAIAPILHEQHPSQQPQPPQHFQQPQQQANAAPPPQAQPPPQQPPQFQQQQPAGQSNLIEFGQTDSTQATSIPPRNSLLQQQTAQQSMNVPPGLQEPMQPGYPLKRVDTLTKDVDEYVDAAAP